MRVTIASLLLISFLSISCSEISEHDKIETEIIYSVIEQFDKLGYLVRDIPYPKITPPPPPKNYIRRKNPDLAEHRIDSLFIAYNKKYQTDSVNYFNRNIDSTKYIIALSDTLVSNCEWCHINSDSSENGKDYTIYMTLLDSLKSGTKNPLKIELKSSILNGKYVLKPLHEFTDNIFEQKYDSLFGGVMIFSRFYHTQEIGLIYWTYYTCEIDCATGYLILLKKKNKKWEIEDVLLQWIT